jgi:hypothetical protein
MPLKFWDQAFITATYLINHLPSRVLNNSTPIELLLGVKPDYSSLRTFGCSCWPNLKPFNQRKLQFRSTQCVFLGYSPLHKGFTCLEVSTSRVYISRDVVFDETIYPFAKLHPNAGSLLNKEILLLPDHGVAESRGPNNANVPAANPHNVLVEVVVSIAEDIGRNREQIGEEEAENGVQLPGADHREDIQSLVAPGSDLRRESALLSAPAQRSSAAESTPALHLDSDGNSSPHLPRQEAIVPSTSEVPRVGMFGHQSGSIAWLLCLYNLLRQIAPKQDYNKASGNPRFALMVRFVMHI